MPITVSEKHDSRTVTTGQNPSAELRYTIHGTNSDTAARSALLIASPVTYDPTGSGPALPRESVTVQPVGYELWDGVVRYAVSAQTADSTYSFETGGGSQHITQSIQTRAKYPPDTAPDNLGAIGATADSVEGVDITVPVYQFSETHYLPDSAVTPAYKAALFRLTGKINDAAFRGFEPYEVLFLGASGTKRRAGDWEITYRFAASPNRTGITIGDITGIAKDGWDYLWVRYEDRVDETAKMLVKVPVAVYVEQVYYTDDFSALGI